MSRRDFHAVNARGITVRSFGDRDLGRDWVRKHSPEHDGLRLEEVETVEHRRVVYRPRPRLALVGVAA